MLTMGRHIQGLTTKYDMTIRSSQGVKTTLDTATMRIEELEGEVDRMKEFAHCPWQAEEVQTSQTAGADMNMSHEGAERAPWGVRTPELEE